MKTSVVDPYFIIFSIQILRSIILTYVSGSESGSYLDIFVVTTKVFFVKLIVSLKI
jgi:hypothetical protein